MLFQNVFHIQFLLSNNNDNDVLNKNLTLKTITKKIIYYFYE